MTKTVVVLGAGIGGLSCAHALAHRGYKVIVIERHSVVGGLARSYVTKDGLPGEYSWRIYGAQYSNLRRVMKQIPVDIQKNNNNNRTVLDNLVDLDDYVVTSNHGTFLLNNNLASLPQLRSTFHDVPLLDIWKFLSAVWDGATSSEQEVKDHLTRVTWRDYLGPIQSEYFDKFVLYAVAPFLGEDLRRVSAAAIIEALEGLSGSNRGKLSVFRGPVNDCWFEPWTNYLSSVNQVDFYLNTQVVQVDLPFGRIDCYNEQDHTHYSLKADWIVCALPVESAAQLIGDTLPSLHSLSRLGRQQMVGVQLYLDRKFEFVQQNKPYNAQTSPVCHQGIIYLPASPWQLVIELQGYVWNYQQHQIANGQLVKDIWSIGLDDPETRGQLIHKTFPECNRAELQAEIWHQIMTSGHLNELLRADDGSTLQDAQILGFHLNDTYQFIDGHMQTYEPKFSDNIFTYQNAPNSDSLIDYNLVFATAYTRGNTFVYNMEKACTNGLRAANCILQRDGSADQESIVVHPRGLPALDWIRDLNHLIDQLYKFR